MYDRISKIKNKIPEYLHGILLTSHINQFYISGFHYSDGLALITKNNSYLFLDSRYYEAGKKNVKNFNIILSKGSITEYLGSVLIDEKIENLGFEDRNISFRDYNYYKNTFPDINFIAIDDFFTNIREIKENDEISNIKSAQAITDKTFKHIIDYITPDKTENEIALEIEFFMRNNGSDDKAFDVIAVSGTASALPHGTPRNCKLEKGFFTMDFGAVVNGYRSDMTRTVCIGKVSDEINKIYNVCLEAQLKTLAFIKKGVKCRDADKTARDYITSQGYGDNFMHSVGHGVGLEIHENPRMDAKAGEKLLEPGHVITIEPGLYFENKYGVRIEDMALITDDGIENLTASPKHLIEIY